jgi:DNA-binding NtrC family response regulator
LKCYRDPAGKEGAMTTKATILVIEDEGALRDILKKVIEKEGYIVDVARTGQGALGKVKKEKYDLIITDLRLPGMSGGEVIKRIEDINPGMKFIIISGYQLDAALEAKIKKGSYSFFGKPFLNQDVVNEIKKLTQI